MIEHDDRDLRKRFEALRREATAGTPPFQATVTAARARRETAAPPRRRALGLAAAAVVALVAIALISTRRHGDGVRVAIDLTTVRWRAPTDFLLTLPGDELLRSVPRLGPWSHDRRTL